LEILTKYIQIVKQPKSIKMYLCITFIIFIHNMNEYLQIIEPVPKLQFWESLNI
jgi:hypothetical protein